MAEYDNTNRGAIWKNKDKVEDKHPDFKGSLNVGGVEYWVSGWKRQEGASEKAPALSFRVQPKDERAKPPARPSGAGPMSDMNDDIPFAPEFR